MSLHTEAIVFATGIRDTMCGDTIVDLTTGATFVAEIEGNLDPFTLPEEFMRDPREKVRLHVTDQGQAACLTKGDKIQFNLYGKTVTFELVDGHADRSQPQSKFLAIQIEPKDS